MGSANVLLNTCPHTCKETITFHKDKILFQDTTLTSHEHGVYPSDEGFIFALAKIGMYR